MTHINVLHIEMEAGTVLIFLCYYFDNTYAAPEHPEINDQFKITTTNRSAILNYTNNKSTKANFLLNSTISYSDNEIKPSKGDVNEQKHTDIFSKNPRNGATTVKRIIIQVYNTVKVPLSKILESEKVITVLRNVGTCFVNGFMDLVTYYLPAPLIPLIATAAGTIIPFEPVVMLRRRMPVTSYRRAIQTAVKGFLNTFDRFKIDNYDDDPYMTRRFNRRFMNEDSKEEKKIHL